MATFARPGFNHLAYSTARPTYPLSLYSRVLEFLTGPRDHCVDLGTGHGIVARALAPHFSRVTATDPAGGMVAQAKELTPPASYPHVTYLRGTAETLSEAVEPGGADLIVAAQCAHWFEYAKAWPELRRALRPGGVFAFWGYGAVLFPRHGRAAEIVDRYMHAQELLGPHWTEPGRSIVEGQYRAVVHPGGEWDDVTRIEYNPGMQGLGSGRGTMLMGGSMKVGDLAAYFRTWSAVHAWKEAHPGVQSRADGASEGDVVDQMFDDICAEEPAFGDPEYEVDLEWVTALVMARRK